MALKHDAAKFQDSVEARIRAGMSKSEAVRDVATKFPELHKAYLKARNGDRPAAGIHHQ